MRRAILICVTLLLLTVVIYAPTRRFDFVSFDDTAYVSANKHVQAGLTAPGFKWAWTTTYYSNWAPLTWLTFMCQAEFFGERAGGYHLVNAALHGINAILLFAVLSAMTGCAIRSGMVAALFAVHPMHVESVAWISEWKDVLSTFFFLLALGSYVRFVRTDHKRWYVALLLCYALSLISKSMAVTLPALLLLLDYWPLRRTAWRRAVLEKLPLLVMAAGSSAMTFVAQSTGKSVAALDRISIGTRLANSALAYLIYIYKLIIPTDLAVFYPYPAHFNVAPVLAVLVTLVVISVLALRLATRRRYLAVGWFWFLGTLIPVIGIVQVGAQSMADRYSYVPSIGLFIVAVWWSADAVDESRVGRWIAGVAAAFVLCLFTVLACQQVQYWRDTESLFVHAAAVTSDNWMADFELGNVAFYSGDLSTAAGRYSQVIHLQPQYPRAYNGLGDCLVRYDPHAAVDLYKKAVELDPDSPLYHANLANAYERTGDTTKALQEHQAAEKMRTE